MADLATADIGPLFENRRDTRAVDRSLWRAIEETGGIVVANYPDAEKVDERARSMLAFFSLSDELKKGAATRVNNPRSQHIYRGYLATLEPGSWAHNEYFDIGPDEPVLGPPIPGMAILEEPPLWPAAEPAPGWRQAMRSYYAHMDRVATAVMLSIGRSAGYSDEALSARFRGGNSTLRLLNYPQPPGDMRIVDEAPDASGAVPDEVPLAAGRHTDAAGVSLLWQAQPGLQAQGPDGVWRDVPPAANCISVHLGDVLEIMTDGRVPATPHRVLDKGCARQSIGFFLEPALGAKLSALQRDDPPVVADAAAAPGTYGWHLLRRMHGYSEVGRYVPYPE